MRLLFNMHEKWDDRVKWSLHRLFYHLFAMRDYMGKFDESETAQIGDWIELCVRQENRAECYGILNQAFADVLSIKESQKDLPKINYKIDKGYPLDFNCLPDTLRYNKRFNMKEFINIPIVKEVREYVEKTAHP